MAEVQRFQLEVWEEEDLEVEGDQHKKGLLLIVVEVVVLEVEEVMGDILFLPEEEDLEEEEAAVMVLVLGEEKEEDLEEMGRKTEQEEGQVWEELSLLVIEPLVLLKTT